MRRLFILFLVVTVGLSAGVASCKKGPSPQEGKVSEPPPEEFKQEVLAPDKIPSPLDSIKGLDVKVDSYKTGSHLTPEDVEANRRLKQQIIRGTFDLHELCRLALDIHWNSLKEADHRYFSGLMTRLLEKKAIFSKEQIKGESKPYRIEYQKQEFLDAEKKSALVATKLTVPTEKVDLNIKYKLTLSPYGWMIYDVIVDEASLVENYKFQFDTIIKKYGYPELVSRMEKKLKEMD